MSNWLVHYACLFMYEQVNWASNEEWRSELCLAAWTEGEGNAEDVWIQEV